MADEYKNEPGTFQCKQLKIEGAAFHNQLLPTIASVTVVGFIKQMRMLEAYQ